MITILDVAKYWGAIEDENGNIETSVFFDLGLPFLTGCEICEETLSPHNSYPTKSEFVKCKTCAESTQSGFESIEDMEAYQEMEEERKCS